MNRVLVAKEWQGMRPFAWLLAVMVLLDLMELGASGLHAWHRTFTLFDGGRWTENAVLSLVLAFAMGSGLLARELEDGTLAFLDGLPVRRRDIFLAKLVVAGACLFAYAAATPALGWLLHAWLRHSVDVPIAAASAAWLATRYALLVLAALALGLLFGFLRYLAWALFAMAGAAVVVLRSAWPRVGTALDPTSLLAAGWSTQGWSGDTVWTFAALAAACLAASYLLFAGAGGIAMLRLARLAQRRAFVVAVCVAGALAVLVAFYLVRERVRNPPDDDQPVAAMGTAASASASASTSAPAATRQRPRKFVTAHYTFNVPAGRAMPDAELKAADAAFDFAASALDIEIKDAPRIDVDLAGSIRHTAGLASYNRIRVNPEPGWHDTLVHETVHVIAGWLAGGERSRGLDRMSLFNEGLAHWAEPGFRGDAALRRQESLALATMFRRHLLNQGELLDDRSLQRKLDWRLQYPLGAGLIEALVKRYGTAAPRRVLATLAQPDFPPALEGLELYRSAFQRAGFDLSLVLHDHAQELQRASAAYADLIDRLPRPRGFLVRANGKAGIATRLDAPLGPGQELVVQFRPRIDSPIDDVVVVEHLEKYGGNQVAWLPLDQVAGNQVCYQLAVRDRRFDMVEPWSCLPLWAADERPR